MIDIEKTMELMVINYENFIKSQAAKRAKGTSINSMYEHGYRKCFIESILYLITCWDDEKE